MSKALLILNGIRFPFGLLNAAIDWCKQNGSALHAIFMKAEDEVGEGYVYPSDLEAAEDLNDTQGSENASIRVIYTQMKLLSEMAATKEIPYSAALLTEPSLEDILAETSNASILFLDGADEEDGLLSISTFKQSELSGQSKCKVKLIS